MKCECCGTNHNPMKTDCSDEDVEFDGYVDLLESAIDAGGRPLNI